MDYLQIVYLSYAEKNSEGDVLTVRLSLTVSKQVKRL